jgi:hypothetical protein
VTESNIIKKGKESETYLKYVGVNDYHRAISDLIGGLVYSKFYCVQSNNMNVKEANFFHDIWKKIGEILLHGRWKFCA